MVTNEETYNKLYDAAERIYAHLVPDKGFFSGVVEDPVTHRRKPTYNEFKGSKHCLEEKMGHRLDQYELTMLSLAIGYGPTPMLSEAERTDAFNTLWEGKRNVTRDCLTMERLTTCI